MSFLRSVSGPREIRRGDSPVDPRQRVTIALMDGRRPSHARRPRLRPDWRALAAGAISGIALGAAARIGVHVGTPAGWLLRLGVPWLLVPFAVGATLRAPAKGASAGAVAMLAAVATYYTLKVGVEHRASTAYGLQMTALWGGIGVLAGLGFGIVGALARDRRSLVRAAATALMSGALAGEAVLMLDQVPSVPAAQAACVLEFGLAALVVLLSARRTRLIPVALVLSAAIAVTAVGAVSEVRAIAFSSGWGSGHQLP